MNENFDNWFSNSITIDTNGKPIIFYHRSRNKEGFSEFKIEGVEKNDFNNDYGVYFVIKEHKSFIDYIADGCEFYCYLRIKNPLYIYDILNEIKDSRGMNYLHLDLNQHFCKQVINEGYDGIIIVSNYYNQYIVFEPNQIKHIHNTGTFDSSNDIYC
jgi:hypothetical protein